MNKVLGIVGGLVGAGGLSGGVAYLVLNNSQTSDATKQQTTEENTLSKTSDKDLDIKKETTAPKFSIFSLLERNNLELLKKGQDSEMVEKWKRKWEIFKPKYDLLKENGDWILENWDSQHKQSNRAPKAFKEKCISNSKKQVEGEADPLYIAVKEYCTEPKTAPLVSGD